MKTYKERKKERRLRLKEQGICTMCRKRKARPGKCLCIRCATDIKERYDYCKRHHYCIQCEKNKTDGDSVYCFPCKMAKRESSKEYYHKNRSEILAKKKIYRKKNKERDKERRLSLKEQGICTICRKRKARPGKYSCIRCKNKDLKYRRSYYHKIEGLGITRCMKCQEPPADGYKLCEKHLAFMKEIGNKGRKIANSSPDHPWRKYWRFPWYRNGE